VITRAWRAAHGIGAVAGAELAGDRRDVKFTVWSLMPSRETIAPRPTAGSDIPKSMLH
jgi:hypothetical protein